MNLLFFEPPASRRVGGLDRAIRSLESFLKESGVTLRCNPPEDVLGKTRDKKMVHFHGLWQKNFPRVSAKCRRLRIPYVVSPHGMLEPWRGGINGGRSASIFSLSNAGTSPGLHDSSQPVRPKQ